MIGSYEENLGDEELIKNRHQFWWFPHMYHHMQVKKCVILMENKGYIPY